MIINKTSENGKLILALEGRLDTTTAPEHQNALTAAIFEEFKKVELDFAKVDYVSSAGLRVLLNWQKLATAGKATMIFKNVSKEIEEIFEMTGFSDIFNIQ